MLAQFAVLLLGQLPAAFGSIHRLQLHHGQIGSEYSLPVQAQAQVQANRQNTPRHDSNQKPIVMGDGSFKTPSVPINGIQQSEYFIVASLGHMQFDDWELNQYFYFRPTLGSSELWVPGYRCGTEWCMNHILYLDYYSESHRANRTYVEVFSDTRGPVYGFVSQDNFTLAGISVIHQDFAEIMSTIAYDGGGWQDPSGYLGLGHIDNAAAGMVPPLYNMFTEGSIEKLVFAINIDKTGSSSELTIGGYDEDKFSGELHTMQVAEKTRWAVNFTDISMGNDTVKLPGNTARFELSASAILLPSDISDIINLQIGARHDPTKDPWETSAPKIIDCAKIDSAPDVIIGLDGRKYPIKASDYILRGEDQCYSLFSSALDFGVAQGISILGAAFLKSYYSVFDLEKGTVSLAAK